MKITKYIEIAQEVEVDISADDLIIILEETGSVVHLLRQLNEIGAFIRDVPKRLVDQLKPMEKEMIYNFFIDQMERYKP